MIRYDTFREPILLKLFVVLLALGGGILCIFQSGEAEEIEIYVGGQKYLGFEEYRMKRYRPNEISPPVPPSTDLPPAKGSSGTANPVIADSERSAEDNMKPVVADEPPKASSENEKFLSPQTLNPSLKTYGDFLPAPGYRFQEDQKAPDVQMNPSYIGETQNSFTDRAILNPIDKNYDQ